MKCEEKWIWWQGNLQGSWVWISEDLGRFRKFAKLKIVLKVENRSCGRFLFLSALW